MFSPAPVSVEWLERVRDERGMIFEMRNLNTVLLYGSKAGKTVAIEYSSNSEIVPSAPSIIGINDVARVVQS